MTDPVPSPTPQASTVWPPAPLQDAALTPLFISAEGVEVTQTGGRLSVVNKFTRRLFALQMCILSLSALSPFYSYWTSPFHHATWRAMLPAVFRTYQNTFWVCLLMLFLAALFYWMLVVYSNLGGIVLDPRSGTAKTNGRTNSLSRIEAVRITRGQPDILRRQFTVSFVWKSGKPVPWWRASLVKTATNTNFLGLFRLEANAEKVAAALAEFANVPVQHRTTAKNSV